MNYAMKTEIGNQLVNEIVQAAAKMVQELDATTEEARQFASRKLLILSAAEGYDEASSRVVTSSALSQIETILQQDLEMVLA